MKIIFNTSHEQNEWTVDLIPTGVKTQTGGRIKRLETLIGNKTFMLTWGDGVADINIRELLAFHRSHGKLATLSAVRLPTTFGHMQLDGDQVVRFSEKHRINEEWINGAFFVLEPGIFDYIQSDDTRWEKEPLERLAQDGQLAAYKHNSFWQCMDTIFDKLILEKYWSSGAPPWKVWEDD